MTDINNLFNENKDEIASDKIIEVKSTKPERKHSHNSKVVTGKINSRVTAEDRNIAAKNFIEKFEKFKAAALEKRSKKFNAQKNSTEVNNKNKGE